MASHSQRQSAPPSSYQPLDHAFKAPSNGGITCQPQLQPQPIKEAVDSAFDKSNVSGQVSQDLVAQITEQVINSLRLNGLGQTQLVGQATQTSASPPIANVLLRNPQVPPQPQLEPLNASASAYEARSRQMDGNNDHNMVEQARERPASPTSAFRRDASESRPCAPPREPTDDATTLEKIWQPLFDLAGSPTHRLGQFLRGLAIHIIQDYEPRHSIVITPYKMLKFYDEVTLADEQYPWNAIFGGTMTNSSISHLYRDLKCQHHFVQGNQFDEKPTIPALTPAGFESWMTHAILADPGLEFERITKAVLDMPISNADDCKERFPKQLSRRLFPMQANEQIREHFEDSILADPVIELLPRRRAAQTSTNNKSAPTPSSAPPHMTPSAVPLPTPASPGVQPTNDHKSDTYQAAYTASDSEVVVDGPPLPVAIERERKPYRAQAGSGKIYDNEADGIVKRGNRSNTIGTGVRPNLDESYDDIRRLHRSGSHNNKPASRISPSRKGPFSPSSRSEVEPVTRGQGPSVSWKQDESDEELQRKYSRDSRRYVPEEALRNLTSSNAPPRASEDEYYRRQGQTSNHGNYGYQAHAPPQTRY